MAASYCEGATAEMHSWLGIPFHFGYKYHRISSGIITQLTARIRPLTGKPHAGIGQTISHYRVAEKIGAEGLVFSSRREIILSTIEKGC
jgi:hypothetical protein